MLALLSSHASVGNEEASDRSGPCTRDACLLMGALALASFGSLGLAYSYGFAYAAVPSHAALAFMLGLRHAVDCDHLAAIDNVTRQFIKRGERPVSIGFWFAVGHSTVVIAMTGFIACGYSMAWKHYHHSTNWSDDVSLASSMLSISILCGIGFLNAKVARELFKEWSRYRMQSREEQLALEEIAAETSLRTALSTIPFLQRVFNHVDRPVKMYTVGLLFGLSFDTATQVGLIGMAAMASTTGSLPARIVMIIPLCFSIGMCLVDTANGLLMLMAYTWATVNPMEKLFYNFLVTALSAVVAIMIGSLEVLQLFAQQTNLQGSLWDTIRQVDMSTLGVVIMVSFFVTCMISVCCATCWSNTSEAETDCMRYFVLKDDQDESRA
jgi:high-affinity nickel-transport protein